ncbi:hypothetical protein [Bacillus toyonensis]|uniref:hypothetical protein n=1 Tax=Bacillus toyonensis TaxID=155322 RepID=UPI0009A7A862|nr:hypothetical protein [Bacillus toyonensis]WIG36133.1 hypothetical protein QPL83_24845 [Bacillus toyonensis]SLK13078.1 hypothetical protein SAMN05880553_3911 [Bacillus toyonensis]
MLHCNEFIRDINIPKSEFIHIQNEGDSICIKGYVYKVNRREFFYLDNLYVYLKALFGRKELNK